MGMEIPRQKLNCAKTHSKEPAEKPVFVFICEFAFVGCGAKVTLQLKSSK
jgi:hypothetical protein